MGGSASLGDALKVLKATNPVTKPGEHTAMVLDPGGLFNVSSNKDVAAHQAKLDIGGYGARPALLAEEAKKQQAAQDAQQAEVSRQAGEAQAALAARQRRLMNVRQSGRASLLSGSELGVQGTTKTLG